MMSYPAAPGPTSADDAADIFFQYTTQHKAPGPVRGRSAFLILIGS